MQEEEKSIKPVKLTEKAFLRMREDGQNQPKKQKVVVQVLETLENKGFPFVILSDGYLKEQAIPYKNIKTRIEDQPLIINSVIEVEVALHREKVFILKLVLIYTKHGNQVIGSPIFYSEYVNNHKKFDRGASNLIPSGILGVDRRESNNLTLISDLNDYIGNITIKARLVHCPDLKKAENADKHSHFIFLDESGSIELTVWKEDLSRFQSILKEDLVYLIKNPKIKTGSIFNKAESSCELSTQRKTKIELVDKVDKKDAQLVAHKKYNLVPISKIQSSVQEGEVIDLIGVVDQEAISIPRTNSKSGKKYVKTEVILIDESNTKISVFTWDVETSIEELNKGQVVILEGVIVGIFRNVRELKFKKKSSRIRTRIPESLPRLKSLIQWINEKRRRNLIRRNRDARVTSTPKPKHKPKPKDIIVVPLKEIKRLAEESLKNQQEYEIEFYSVVNIVGFQKQLTWAHPDHQQDHWFALIKICDHSEEIWAMAGNQACKVIINEEDITKIGILSRGGKEEQKELKDYLFTRCFKEYLVSITAKIDRCFARRRVVYIIKNAYGLYDSPPILRKVNQSLLKTLTDLCSK